MIPHVLVIDDEAVFARNVCIYLERGGMRVEIANTGEAGLDLVGKHQPQVVVLDYNLPGMDGLEALARIRALAPRARVIAMTGSGENELAARFRAGGAADCLSKPFALGSLRERVESLLQ